MGDARGVRHHNRRRLQAGAQPVVHLSPYNDVPNGADWIQAFWIYRPLSSSSEFFGGKSDGKCVGAHKKSHLSGSYRCRRQLSGSEGPAYRVCHGSKSIRKAGN